MGVFYSVFVSELRLHKPPCTLWKSAALDRSGVLACDGGPMSEPAKVFEDRELPGQWRVEWFGDDGRCELQTFTGPTARREVLRYAMQNYRHFKEVQLEPNPTP